MESRRVKVTVANNGQEAIECIHSHRPDYFSVVLMDLQMPVMDGYEATRLLRLDSRYVKLPIVAMTAHAMADERERCLVLGMNGHVSKPIDPEMLYATLAEYDAPGGAVRPGPTTAPATRAEPISAADPGLPEIVGLDVRSGLRHAGGKAAFYSQLLQRFASDFAAFAKLVESMLTKGDWEGAAREAHTLKGLAASLGASELQPRAGALELAARAHDLVQSHNHLAKTAECLAPLVSALRLHFGIDELPRQKARSDGMEHFAVEAAQSAIAFAAWLRRFRDLLREADVEARELWASRPEEVEAQLPPHVVQRISLALENFEFDAALRLLPESPIIHAPDRDSGASS